MLVGAVAEAAALVEALTRVYPNEYGSLDERGVIAEADIERRNNSTKLSMLPVHVATTFCHRFCCSLTTPIATARHCVRRIGLRSRLLVLCSFELSAQ